MTFGPTPITCDLWAPPDKKSGSDQNSSGQTAVFGHIARISREK